VFYPPLPVRQRTHSPFAVLILILKGSCAFCGFYKDLLLATLFSLPAYLVAVGSGSPTRPLLDSGHLDILVILAPLATKEIGSRNAFLVTFDTVPRNEGGVLVTCHVDIRLVRGGMWFSSNGPLIGTSYSHMTARTTMRRPTQQRLSIH
jgi:hypothetical protein